MLIDTHCHINCMIRGHQAQSIYMPFTQDEKNQIDIILHNAYQNDTTTIINVGTDYIESLSCIELAKLYSSCYAIIGIHPNDIKQNWQDDLAKLKIYVQNAAAHKIIGIGEVGIDLHYPNYNLQLQKDAFKAHIELALTYNLALSIHSRDAAEETFMIIDNYKKESNFRGIMHCFAYNQSYAQDAINSNLVLGIGGTVTYPKNETLRTIVKTVELKNIVLETDAPFLPPQIMRGKKNNPAQIQTIAQFIAQLRSISYEQVAQITSSTVKNLFKL